MFTDSIIACKEYFYISLFQLEVYVLKFLVLLQLFDVSHSALVKDNTRNKVHFDFSK